MRITIVGMGYVGLANALTLAKKHIVTLLDINKNKVENFNKGILPIHEDIFDNYFSNQTLKITATYNENKSYQNAECIILAIPTNFDNKINSFDTSSLDKIILKIAKLNPSAKIIIKSTVPIGYTENIKVKTNFNKVYFCPEFLRENKALSDCLKPSRIIVGGNDKNIINEIYSGCCEIDDSNIMFVSNTEAEAIKLFSNSYLAMRVAFFNEVDSYALFNNLNSKNIINGICKDKRIGDYYNNPSFGYGGYCLPKDTLQLTSQVGKNKYLIQSIDKSNEQRIKSIANYINKNNYKSIGIFKLEMKKNSSNYRNSSILKIIKLLKCKNILIYEPTLTISPVSKATLCNDINEFKLKSDIIITNRYSISLNDVKIKVFSRDIYNRD